MFPHRVEETARVIRAIALNQGDSHAPDVYLIDVWCDDTSVMMTYRHRYSDGVFGYRGDVMTEKSLSDNADPESMAVQLWYAEVEPVPDLSELVEVNGVQWGGDAPYPQSPPAG